MDPIPRRKLKRRADIIHLSINLASLQLILMQMEESLGGLDLMGTVRRRPRTKGPRLTALVLLYSRPARRGFCSRESVTLTLDSRGSVVLIIDIVLGPLLVGAVEIIRVAGYDFHI
jgi:hypothetical protein